MISCPACQSDRTKPCPGMHWKEQGVVHTLQTCESCGMAFISPFPMADVLNRHYATTFNYAWYQSHYPAKYIDAKRRLIESKAWLGKSILDFGGGMGYLAEAARRLGHDSAVFDPYRPNDPSLLGKTWDTIFCLHVLEHSPDPASVLRQLHDLLNPGGVLILAVPNADGQGYARLRSNWHWFQAPLTHLLHFTPSALCKLVHRCGFALEGLTFHDRWDANTVADIHQVVQTRSMEAHWGDVQTPEEKAEVACRNARYRFTALRACPNPSQDNPDLAEILLISRKAA